MKIKPFKILGNLLLGAAPIAAGVFVSPAAGAGVAALMGALGLTKKAGQAIEQNGIKIGEKEILPPGVRPHKAGIPAIILALPMILTPLIPEDVMTQIQTAACAICEDPKAIVTVVMSFLGIGTLFAHQLATGMKKTIDDEPPVG